MFARFYKFFIDESSIKLRLVRLILHLDSNGKSASLQVR